MIWRGAGKLTLVLGMALQLAIPVEALAQNNNFYRQQQWQQQQQWQRQQEMQRQQTMRQQQMLRDQQMRQQQAQRQMQMQRQRAWQQPRSQPGFRPQQGVQRPQQAQGGFRIFRSPQQQGQQYGRPLPRQQAANQNRFSIFRSPSQQPAARLWRNNPQSQNALAAQRRNFFNAARGVTVRSGQFLRASYSARAADVRRWLASRTVTAQRGSNNGGARAWFAQWRGKFTGPKVVAGGPGGNGGHGGNGGNWGRRPPFSAQIAANDNKAYRKTSSNNIASSDRYKRELLARSERPKVTNKDLDSIIEKLYRKDAKYGINGSTASAVRYEISSGEKVGNRFHSQKAQDSIRELQNWIRRNPTASKTDIAAAENTISDLRSALSGN